MSEIRVLKASEIECRVGQCGKSQSGKGWCSILLYKDARCDQRILDELYGPMGWQRRHEAVNGQVCCIVKVRDPETKEWIEKEDVGTESNTEAVKGAFSDAFKRACFNLGIGRELYTSPKIFITLGDSEMVQKGGKWTVSPRVSFTVAEIGYDENRIINALTIVDGDGVVRYKLGQAVENKAKSDGDNEFNENLTAYILPALEQANTEDEVRRVWDEYTAYQDKDIFRKVVSKRLDEIRKVA